MFLPSFGEYQLHLEIGEEPEIINIQKYGLNTDTFYIKRVNLAVYASNPPHSEFFDCNKLANGAITDYYYNGSIRLTSNFKNGQPIDTLKRYYRNGMTQEVYIPQKRKRQQIYYFKNGNIKY